MKKIPKEFISRQKYIQNERIQKAMRATELHKLYKESDAQFVMTFAEFKKNKGRRK